jgi:hypothetical protein
MGQWQFFQDAAGGWCWRQSDVQGRALQESDGCHSSRTDCIAEAMCYGYLSRPVGSAERIPGMPWRWALA